MLTCAHYPNCDHFIIDTANIKSISPHIQRIGKSLSAPNLTIDSDSHINKSSNNSDVNDSQKSVTFTASDANNTFDEIESVRTGFGLHEIDWYNSNACLSVCDSDHAIDEVQSSNFLLPINNTITSELCQHSLTDEGNGFRELVVLRENVSTMSRNSLCDKNDQIEDKLMDQSVILNDYFDSDKCEADSGKPSLLSDRKNVVSSRNSRRRIVADKRLRNAVLDRLKRLAVSKKLVVFFTFFVFSIFHFHFT